MKHYYNWLLLLCLFLFSTAYCYAIEGNKLPYQTALSFLENKGQVTDQYGNHRADVDYLLKGKNFQLYVSNTGLYYQWTKTILAPNKNTEDKTEAARIDVILKGANTTTPAEAYEPLSYYERYYGNTTDANGIKAASYRKIIYRNVYPHIDWVLYIANDDVKYDFIVHPGGRVSDIQIAYNGAASLQLKQGALYVASPMGSVTEAAPYTYYQADKRSVESKYQLNGNTLSFQTADNTPTSTMVIDPTLDWSTYFGGMSIDFAYAVTSDTSGNSYLVGHTTSSSSIATTGAYQSVYASNKDAFIACFDSAGVLQWSTYYGGSGSDNFFYVASDTLGGIYASGITSTTTGMTTTGAHQTAFGGGVSDAYLVKFDATGARVWATYYGGPGDEAVAASFDDYYVSVTWAKADNKVYLCGMTTSTTNIATSSAYKSSPSGNKDGYLAQFNTAGVLQWATYFGGPGDDKIVKLSADANGSIYFTGVTNSGIDIATTGSHQPSLSGGFDAFIAKFTPAGNIVWCTYYGGTNDDGSSGIANDNLGNVYIAGATTSTNNISTTGSFQPAISGTGPSDAYLVKFNSSGARQWATYLGGTFPDNTADIAIDANNNICFSGTTGSPGISTPGSYQSNFGGNSDAFFAVFGPQGSRTWVTYLGGTDADNGFGISFSRTGDLFVAGNTSSIQSIASPGTHQPNNNGSQDGFLAKFKADTSAYVNSIIPFVLCQGDSTTVSFGITNPFLSNNTFTVQLSDANGSFGTFIALGSVSTNLPGSIRVKIPDTVLPGTQYRVRMVFTSPAGVGYANSQNITIKLRPDRPAISSNSPICSGNFLAFTASSLVPGVSYSWVGPNNYTSTLQTNAIFNAPTHVSGKYLVTATLNGCISKDSFTAVVDSTPLKPTVTSNGPTVCSGNTIVLSANSGTAGVNYEWTGPAGYTSTLQAPVIAVANNTMSGTYIAKAKLLGCSTQDSTTLSVFNTLTPHITATMNPMGNICLGDLVRFTTADTGGGPNPVYQWHVNGIPVSGANSPTWSSTNLITGDMVYCVITAANWPCLTKLKDSTNSFSINALGNVPPTCNIYAQPGLTVPTGTAITFMATHTNMGNNPTYKWLLNGVTVQDSKVPVYIAVVDKDIRAGDNINLVMTSDLVCAEPDTALSNTLTIGKNIILNVSNTGNTGSWVLLPNPNNGRFTLKGTSTERSHDIDITDALGRIVYKETIHSTQDAVTHQVQTKELSAGVYMLRVKSGEASGYLRFSIVQ